MSKYLVWDMHCKVWIHPSSLLFVNLTDREVNDIYKDEDKTIHEPKTLEGIEERNKFVISKRGQVTQVKRTFPIPPEGSW